MRLVIQRVDKAKVQVNNKTVGQIKKGLLVYLGISKNFSQAKLDYITNKLLKLRLYQSKEKGFDLSIEDIKGEILIISQFTLFGDCKSSNKPNFNNAMEYQKANQIYNQFIQTLKQKTNLKIEQGEFGAMMKIESTNDGPVTIILEK